MRSVREPRVFRAISILIAACLGVCPAQAQYGGGSGTAADPYQIWTAEQMNAIGAEPNDWDKHFKLMADLDLSAHDGRDGRPSFNIIGTAAELDGMDWRRGLFAGVFDGNGHTISNFTCVSGMERPYAGLFGYVAQPTGEVRNLGLIDAAVDADGRWSVGALVGSNAGVILHCYSTGSVRGTGQCVGGLVGYNYGVVVGCYSTVAVGGDGAGVGGLVGENDEGAVIHCFSRGSVVGKSIVGGLVGGSWEGDLIHCYSTGIVSSLTGTVAGLVGRVFHSMDGDDSVVSCLWDMQTSGQSTSAEGMGLTTAQMQDIQTYVDAGWDWVGTAEDGTSDVWQMPEGGGYPILTFFQDHIPRNLQGSGTPDNPYLISDALDLGMIVCCSPGSHYRLAAAVDLSGIHWRAPVVPWLLGTFDGAGLTISHLTIEGDGHLGLFGRLRHGAQIANLGIVDANIVGAGVYNCSLVSCNEGVVTRCFSAGSVHGSVNAGGLIGMNAGEVTDCYSEAAVSAERYCGDLVGSNLNSVTHCYSIGEVDVADGSGSSLAGYGAGIGCFGVARSSASRRGGDWQPPIVPDMQDKQTYLDAGWDWVGETANGTSEVWQMPEEGGYPVLAIFGGHTPRLRGSGTSADPYLISDALDLGAVTYHNPSAHYRLVAPIDLSGIRWAAPVIPSLRGVFDGNGVAVSHLTIQGAGYLGLIGMVCPGAEVRDLGVVDCNIVGSAMEVGGVVGSNAGTLRRCYSTGEVRNTAQRTGGLVGYGWGGVIQCFSTCRVIGSGMYVGGLVGCASGVVADCYSQGVVQGTMLVGGLVGDAPHIMTRCYSASAVSSTEGGAGGLCGSSLSEGVTSCFWDVEASGQTTGRYAVGKTTAEMRTASTFLNAGWDFVGETANGTEDIWWIREGQDYPRLWWEAVEE
ncbi:MAG: hypothetical protein KBE65_23125 [Phycisphaerae bacterium]|nr:hypothetical protein [Phycisphaerae bacterium]